MEDNDLDSFRNKPDFKDILRAVLKHQMKFLVEQLSKYGDEEVMVLITSLSEGVFSHLGSSGTQGFLDNRADIKSQFMGHCIENHLQQSTESAAPGSMNSSLKETQTAIPYAEQSILDGSIHSCAMQPELAVNSPLTAMRTFVAPRAQTVECSTQPYNSDKTPPKLGLHHTQSPVKQTTSSPGMYSNRTGIKRPCEVVTSEKSVRRKTVHEHDSVFGDKEMAIPASEESLNKHRDDNTCSDDNDYVMIKTEKLDVDKDDSVFDDYVTGQLDASDSLSERTATDELADSVSQLKQSFSAQGYDAIDPEHVNINTWQKISSDLRTFYDWLRLNNEYRNVEDIPPPELDELLSKMFSEIMKKDGTEYEPLTLKSIMNSIHRKIQDLKLPYDLKNDEVFTNCRKILETRIAILKAAGKGKKKYCKKPAVFSQKQIKVLQEKKLLGGGSPEALLSSLWMNIHTFFEIKERGKHVSLVLGDILLKTTEDGLEYLELSESKSAEIRADTSTATSTSTSRIFARKEDPNCPVSLYKHYKTKRPPAQNGPDARFYLRPAAIQGTRVWFSQVPLGKHSLAKLISTLKVESEDIDDDQP